MPMRGKSVGTSTTLRESQQLIIAPVKFTTPFHFPLAFYLPLLLERPEVTARKEG